MRGATLQYNKQTTVRMAKIAFDRRLSRVGATSLLEVPPSVRVVYLDAGLHRKASQLRLVSKWFGGRYDLRSYGFEAHPDYLRDAANALQGTSGVSFVNAALVGPGQGSSVELYVSAGTGVASSLLRPQPESIKVPALRLSDFIAKEKIDVERSVVLLRMNIEGAEPYVLEDLFSTGLIEHVDGFYGAWDDPHKIGGEIASRFDRVMTETGIETFRFNDKDCRSRLRLAIIHYDMITSIIAGARAKALAR